MMGLLRLSQLALYADGRRVQNFDPVAGEVIDVEGENLPDPMHVHGGDEPRADHAQYLASWLSVLKADKKAIVAAASKASEAAAFLSAASGDVAALPDAQHSKLT